MEPLDVDALLREVEAEIDKEIAELDCPSVWALRMVFESDDGERIARLYPLTFPSEVAATEMSELFGSTEFSATNAELFAVLAAKGRWVFPSGKTWSGVYHTVVELTVVPNWSEETEGPESGS